jgi:hypothetical protein
MTRDVDPSVMIDQLEALSARYTTSGRRTLVRTPSEYASALTAEKRMKELHEETNTRRHTCVYGHAVYSELFGDCLSNRKCGKHEQRGAGP